jgi:hypothetical protein
MDPPTRESGATAGTGIDRMFDPLIHLGHAVASPIVFGSRFVRGPAFRSCCVTSVGQGLG